MMITTLDAFLWDTNFYLFPNNIKKTIHERKKIYNIYNMQYTYMYMNFSIIAIKVMAFL